ncbi:hypothetical protein [Rubellicoccus peritrichatus]|uniref:Uncharacterized protein n=1 Tax=Rubellicoccus peritrichatus TaxID=3080537 RepID=A0AAQ3L819_9BACT|nr:hypothetical protein [Puniceicoccus sp. CR14]WOO40776.1 hypothetical protein RZN69_19305 [Puniceicoccus sp. CR14]
MDLPPLGPVNEFIPVPKNLWSFLNDGPFERCSICDRNLREPGVVYLIEKAFRGDEPVFEYAMCHDCCDNLSSELSVKSLELINNYYEEHVDLVARRERLLSNHGLDPKPWFDKCMIKNREIKPREEHQICALCQDGDMLFSYMPFCLSGEAVDDIVKLLSDQTLGVIDDFIGKHFGSPDSSDLPKIILI